VPEDDHFRLYGKLDVKRDYAALSTLPGSCSKTAAELDPLDFSCIYMALVQQELGFEIPQPGCSNGCC